MQTYFFDVTDIVLYVEKETTVSGIQRVSLGVIKRAVAKLGADRVKGTGSPSVCCLCTFVCKLILM